MDTTVMAPVIDERIAPPRLKTAPREVRRRTLGLCAHCRKPVDITDEYVRLYRRAWHLDCALASEPAADRTD